MAKSRQQRKAEKRARQQGPARQEEARAQRDTQQPVSGEVAEAEAVIQTGAELEAPAPSRDDTVAKEEKRERRRRRDEADAKPAKAPKAAKPAQSKRPPAPEPRRRGRVIGFFVSCWHELKRVQWPDRETLVQASAVTLLFVAVAAVYLGALDFVFNRFVQFIL